MKGDGKKRPRERRLGGDKTEWREDGVKGRRQRRGETTGTEASRGQECRRDRSVLEERRSDQKWREQEIRGGRAKQQEEEHAADEPVDPRT